MHDGTQSLDLQECLEAILERYAVARRVERFGSEHPLWTIFARTNALVTESVGDVGGGELTSKWSVGQGRWATVPWIAVLHPRETSGVSSGVFVAYLFRGDQSGVYLTLNQGSSRLLSVLRGGASRVLRERAQLLLARVPESVLVRGFVEGRGSDYRAQTKLAAAYSDGCVIHKLYERGSVPTSGALRADLKAVSEAYIDLVPSRRYLSP